MLNAEIGVAASLGFSVLGFGVVAGEIWVVVEFKAEGILEKSRDFVNAFFLSSGRDFLAHLSGDFLAGFGDEFHEDCIFFAWGENLHAAGFFDDGGEGELLTSDMAETF